jgi:signal transduction histidine kinase
MSPVLQIRRLQPWWIVGAIVMLALAAFMVYRAISARRLPYMDSFAQNKSDEWHAYGGSWAVHNGTMRNESDERGARLVAGDSRWGDYRLDVDLRFLSLGGDMGVVVRSNDEDLGVDAYNGYYIGLRRGDNSLIMGRSDHGWMETRPQHLPGDIHPLDWFHLTVIAVGCKIAAAVVNPETGKTAYMGMEEDSCVATGRIGLRSLATGGEWRNVRVTKSTTAELEAISLHIANFSRPSSPQSEAEYNSTHSFPTYDDTRSAVVADDGSTVPGSETISTLASLKDGEPRHSTARGVVVLSAPVLYIEDSTAGIAVYAWNTPLLNLGDEVEVTGIVNPNDYSTEIHDASVRLLWGRAPLPPLAVTAAQAATGAVDSRLVEIPGHLERLTRQGGSLTMTIGDGEQSFQAIASGGDTDSLYRRLALQSLLRLRGICVLNPRYTHSVTPFILLLRSSDDVSVVEGPPWWSARHLTQIAFALLLLAFISLFIYGRVERWRLRSVTQERVRLAHELHDALAQSFAGLGFQLQGIRNRLRNPSANLDVVHRQLDIACDIVRDTHEEASLSIVLLREDLPQVTDLLKALESCASQMVFGGNIAVELFTHGTPRLLPLRVADALFHIGREAIVNAVRHGRPSRISIDLEYADRATILRVNDDGSGFDRQQHRGMGLRGIERRATAAALRLTIVSASGEGTLVQVEAPVEERGSITTWVRLKSRSLALKLNAR